MTTRTHFTFRVDTWTPDGESIVRTLPVQDVTLAPARACFSALLNAIWEGWNKNSNSPSWFYKSFTEVDLTLNLVGFSVN